MDNNELFHKNNDTNAYSQSLSSILLLECKEYR